MSSASALTNSPAVIEGTSSREHLFSLHVSPALKYCAAVIYGLPVVTFTLPTGMSSTGPASYLLAVLKMSALIFTVMGGFYLASRNRRTREFRQSCSLLFGFIVFLGWAIFSIAWSPLKGVSIAQTGWLTAQLLLAVHVGTVARSLANLSWLMKHLSYSLLLYNLVILIAFFIDPTVSGLDRTVLSVGGDGMIHPTASGAAASLGLVICALALLGGRFPWARRMVVPSLIIHGSVLYLSHSRTAMAMAVVVIACCVFYFGNRLFRAGILLSISIAAIGLMLFDPALLSLSDSDNPILSYLRRGQDAGEIYSGSGRAEMWQAVWSEYQHAILMGHGYFVTSRTGELLVWHHYANHTAHNVFLQVLASTGIVGFAIWILSFLRVGVGFLGLAKGDLFAKRFLAMLGFIALWYVGWTTGCDSFMGPVRSETVFFFAFLGLGVGQSSRIADANCADRK